ncbi:TlyA family rRNA (cytidine-2'-O)-methyltransferase [soil metagenome]
MSRTPRIRADELVVRQGLAKSRTQAKVLILAGDIRTADRRITKPAEQLPVDTELKLKEKQRFVSRGGLKLDAALAEFRISVAGLVAADIGASTGGFTDCLLQAGAVRVYAVDVGYGQLDYSLRTDDRVIVMERVNARYMDQLPEPADLITIDVSFISIRLILESVLRSLAPRGRLIALVKPQFEAGKDQVTRQGVVRDERTRERVVREIIAFAADKDLGVEGVIRSPVVGPAGNEEFLVSFVESLETSGERLEQLLRAVFPR